MSRVLFLSSSAGLSGDMLLSALVEVGGDSDAPALVADSLDLPVSLKWQTSPRRKLLVEGGERTEALEDFDLRLAEVSLPLDVRIPAHTLLRERAAALRERSVAADTSLDLVANLLLLHQLGIKEIVFDGPPTVGHSPAAEKLLPAHLRSANGHITEEMLTPTAAALLRFVPSRIDASAAPSNCSEVDGDLSAAGEAPPLRAGLF